MERYECQNCSCRYDTKPISLGTIECLNCQGSDLKLLDKQFDSLKPRKLYDDVIYLHIHTDLELLDMQAISEQVSQGSKTYLQFTSSMPVANIRSRIHPQMFGTVEMTREALNYFRDRAIEKFSKQSIP